jgi:hypothetical protein
MLKRLKVAKSDVSRVWRHESRRKLKDIDELLTEETDMEEMMPKFEKRKRKVKFAEE